MPVACVVVLIGLPAAGKTTLCSFLMRKITTMKDITMLHVSYDCLSLELNCNTYKCFRNCAVKYAEAKIIEWEEEENKSIIVVDDNMFYRSMRHQYYRLARKHNAGYCQVFVKCSIETAVNRNNFRKSNVKIQEDSIQKMSSKLEVPSNILIWEEKSCIISSENMFTNMDVDYLWSIISSAVLHSSFNKKIVPDQECSLNNVNQTHHFDLILRKLVKKICQEKQIDINKNETVNMPLLAKQLSNKKYEILNYLRKGSVYRETCSIENVEQLLYKSVHS